MLDHIGERGIARLVAKEAAPRGLGEFGVERGRDEGPALHEIVSRIAEVKRLEVLVLRGLQLAQRLARRFAEHDLEHRRDLQQPLVIRVVFDAQELELDRLRLRAEHRQLQMQPVALRAKDRDARLVAHLVTRIAAAQRREGRREEILAREVEDVDRLSRRRHAPLAHSERREAVQARIAAEGEDLAVIRQHGADAQRIGDHMGEGPRRVLRDRKRAAIRREGETRRFRRLGREQSASARQRAIENLGRDGSDPQQPRHGLGRDAHVLRPAVENRRTRLRPTPAIRSRSSSSRRARSHRAGLRPRDRAARGRGRAGCRERWSVPDHRSATSRPHSR